MRPTELVFNVEIHESLALQQKRYREYASTHRCCEGDSDESEVSSEVIYVCTNSALIFDFLLTREKTGKV